MEKICYLFNILFKNYLFLDLIWFFKNITHVEMVPDFYFSMWIMWAKYDGWADSVQSSNLGFIVLNVLLSNLLFSLCWIHISIQYIFPFFPLCVCVCRWEKLMVHWQYSLIFCFLTWNMDVSPYFYLHAVFHIKPYFSTELYTKLLFVVTSNVPKYITWLMIGLALEAGNAGFSPFKMFKSTPLRHNLHIIKCMCFK